MDLRFAGLTDVGRKRDHNEDSFLIQPADNLFVVCDGMGGHASGEVASKLACEKIGEFFEATRDDDDVTWPYKEDARLSRSENRLAVGIKLANFSVYEMASSSLKYKGMGTTCVAAFFDEGRCAVAHVGDSRCYRLRGGDIEQLTSDHSLLNEYRKLAKMTQDEIKNFPHKNIITRALGMKAHVVVDTRVDDVHKGDVYLLCCDGLTGELEPEQISRIVQDAGDDLEGACAALIEAANDHGGKDNITVVLVEAA